jgi:hypothetical protein
MHDFAHRSQRGNDVIPMDGCHHWVGLAAVMYKSVAGDDQPNPTSGQVGVEINHGLLRPAIFVTHLLRGGGTNESVLQFKASDITRFKQDGHALLL